MTLTKEEGKIFQEQLLLLENGAELDSKQALKDLFLLFNLVFEEITNSEELHFTFLTSISSILLIFDCYISIELRKKTILLNNQANNVCI